MFNQEESDLSEWKNLCKRHPYLTNEKHLKSHHSVIPVYGAYAKLRIVPMGVVICHLINSLHKASMYGRRGLSSNVGSRSLPITTSSSFCARLWTCGKRTRARKRKDIDDTVWRVEESVRNPRENPETRTVSVPAKRALVSLMYLIHECSEHTLIHWPHGYLNDLLLLYTLQTDQAL
jgi:hypothetical protein